MASKLILLAFYVATVSNNCESAQDDKCITLNEVKDLIAQTVRLEISSLENKVDKLLDEVQSGGRHKDTGDCPTLLVENAIVSPCTGTITHGSFATISCLPGFTIVGKSTVTCKEGKYDSIPSCKADCKPLSRPNAEVKPVTQVAHGGTVQVECLGINTLVGEPTVMCNDGSYGDIPSCVFDVSAVTAVYREKIPIKLKGEYTPPSVFSAEFLPDGRILVVDNANEKVKLFSSSFSYEGSVEIERPYAVAVINDTMAIVSSYSRSDPKLYFMSVTPSLQIQSTISLNHKSFGIDVYNGTIYITCHDYNQGQGHVRLLDMNGKLKGTLGVNEGDDWKSHMFRRPVCVRVSRFTRNVFVSDWSAETVTCLSPKGDVIFKFKNTDVLVGPENFILDDRDNVAVLGRGTGIVEILNYGNDYKIMPRYHGGAAGLEIPDTLAYRQTDSMLLVGGYSSSDMYLYQLISSK